MNKKSAELVRLVKSLSLAEKKFCRNSFVFYSAGIKRKEYEALFDLIDKQSNLSEKKLEDTFGKQKLPSLKHSLYNTLLTALGQFDGSLNKGDDVIAQLRIIKTLLNKELFEEAIKLGSKLLTNCMSEGKYKEALMVSDYIESAHAANTSQEGHFQAQKERLASEKVLLETLAREWEIKHTCVDVHAVLAGGAIVERELYINSLDKVLPLSDGRLFVQLSFYMACLKQDITLVKKRVNDFLELLLTEEINSKEFFDYLLLSVRVWDKPNEEGRSFFLSLFKKLPAVSSTMEYKRVFKDFVEAYFNVFSSKQLVKFVERKNKDYLLNLIQAETLYYLSYAAQQRKDFDLAIRYQVKIIVNPTYVSCTDLLVYAKIMNVISNFDSGNYSILGYLHQQVLHAISRSGKLYDFEIQFMNYMRTVRKFKTQEEKREFYTKLLKKLQTISSVGSLPITYRFDFFSWIEAKVSEPL